MKTLGICLGASTISLVEVEHGKEVRARLLFSQRHEGNPQQVLKEALAVLRLHEYHAVAVTGRKLCNAVNLSVVQEPEASEYAFEFVNREHKKFDALVSAGGETFMVYILDKAGKITTACTGSKCASGTGEFFLQQIRRMDLDISEAIRLARSSTPFKVAGRCSVFCKSDCTHALNRNEPKGNVVAGLCEMVAGKICELLQKTPKNNVMVVGGVAQNQVVIDGVKKEIKHVVVPEEAHYFEALGAALWAVRNPCQPIDEKRVFKEAHVSFSVLPRLKEAEKLVTFKELPYGVAQPHDECVIGLDVGSTTTKAVLVRLSDANLLASVYLRTLGQPVEAAKNCYRDFLKKIPPDISIVGLGVTGSGRQIAGLHALTKDIVNEIIAHAHAAAYFDKDVDTIFEIGGQDAKYTHLVNGVPCDYAMNEACSAGTGSFLEEACKETLGVEMEEISDIALQSQMSPNFNDQCAAFISGDIKTAIHEGIKKEDIIAGLVYSICMNYSNRVKGSRPTGKKIFMQGGVCYIKAVPLAMAAFIEKPIIVPPHPGLMGAFGVALEVRNRLHSGQTKKVFFDLKRLIERQVEYGKSFVCQGAGDDCDRKCEIASIKLETKTYPFGGACNRYYNMRMDVHFDAAEKDLVHKREKFLFDGFTKRSESVLSGKDLQKKTVGINLSFLTHSLFPLYKTFFSRLGFQIVVPDNIHEAGVIQQGSNFCYPASASHGWFLDLLHKNTDYIFLPQISEIPVKNAISVKPEHQSTCHILQAEPYYLKSAFKELIPPDKCVSPVINFSQGFQSAENDFIRIGRLLGKRKKLSRQAYEEACKAQEEFTARMKKAGIEFMEGLKSNPNETAIVLFGRFYNAFCPELNLNVPHKFASRGVTIIPYEFLPYESVPYQGPQEFFGENLTWATGQMIMRAASFVEKHPQLFATFITNFSCGPDSFLVNYFRQVMKDKPSLTLEVDSHTADAGVNTRIEAFLDIVARYRYLKESKPQKHKSPGVPFVPARVVYRKGLPRIISSEKKEFSIFSPKVHLLIPSMGDLGTDVLTAVFERIGIRTTAMGVPDAETLKFGRMHSNCKECLPLILCCGNLLKYLKHRKDPEEILVYFMPTVGGNCRFSQYGVFLQNLINRNQLRNVAQLSLTSENGYVGFGSRFNVAVFKAAIVSDVFDDIRNTLTVLAKNPKEAERVFKAEWQKILKVMRTRVNGSLERQLKKTAKVFKEIPLTMPIEEAKFVSLLGEIFVRKEVFSRQGVVDRLTQRGIIPRTASVVEWLYYVDHLVKKGIIASHFNLKKRVEFMIKNSLQYMFEKRIKRIIAKSGLYSAELVDMDKLIEHGVDLIPLELTGEPIIVIGAALSEVMHTVAGVVSIGPFSCLPTRVTESILSKEMNMETKRRLSKDRFEHVKHLTELPFLSVEVDGNAFPPVMEAKLEAFCLQVERVHQIMRKHGKHHL